MHLTPKKGYCANQKHLVKSKSDLENTRCRKWIGISA
jgi:hypothetical protein